MSDGRNLSDYIGTPIKVPDQYVFERDETIVYRCCNCDEPIFDGEAYYLVGERRYCEDCVDGFRAYADMDDIKI